MRREAIERSIDQQRWLESVGEVLGNAVIRAKIASGKRAVRVLDFLHGVWLGHPPLVLIIATLLWNPQKEAHRQSNFAAEI